jgi:hypothetical protein
MLDDLHDASVMWQIWIFLHSILKYTLVSTAACL